MMGGCSGKQRRWRGEFMREFLFHLVNGINSDLIVSEALVRKLVQILCDIDLGDTQCTVLYLTYTQIFPGAVYRCPQRERETETERDTRRDRERHTERQRVCTRTLVYE